VPILTNLMLAQRSGEAAGRALYWSTLGSFLGSVTLSLIVMQASASGPPSCSAR
jgi:hypothetical protein